MEATVPENQSAVPDAAEALVLLGEAARAGSVSAMKELLAHHRERRQQGGDALSAVDELAAKRASQSGGETR